MTETMSSEEGIVMANEIKMPGAPPEWVNALMVLMLRTPLVQRVVGRKFALMTVEGAKTGRRYTIPVSYRRHDGELYVGTQRRRQWWRNIETCPDVEVRVEGVTMHGRARIASENEARSVLADLARREPRVAKFYGLEPDDAGEIRAEELALEQVVVIMVTPQPIGVELESADLAMQES
jgi:deazaflavin-dependent oxidoreductase (nitroreductase family)